jgi:hypothetical protein
LSKALTEEEVDKRVDVWHDMDDEEFEAEGRPSLHEFLGWTFQEYARWVRSGCRAGSIPER